MLGEKTTTVCSGLPLWRDSGSPSVPYTGLAEVTVICATQRQLLKVFGEKATTVLPSNIRAAQPEGLARH
jgi:hypothetical protein